MKTLELTPGATVRVPAALNRSAFTGTVEGVKPWILGAGPHAGQQARQGRKKDGPLLWVVRVVAVSRTAPPTARVAAGSVDAVADEWDIRDMAVPADHEWDATA
jgi:hypothetical protein